MSAIRFERSSVRFGWVGWWTILLLGLPFLIASAGFLLFLVNRLQPAIGQRGWWIFDIIILVGLSFCAFFTWLFLKTLRFSIWIDEKGLRLRQGFQATAEIPWKDIHKVHIRGFTNKNGLVRKLTIQTKAGHRSKVIYEHCISHFGALANIIKLMMDQSPNNPETANTVSLLGRLKPTYWDSCVMPEGLRWTDHAWIAIALQEALPDIDPGDLSSDQMQGLIRELEGFEEETKPVPNGALEKTREAWTRLCKRNVPELRHLGVTGLEFHFD